MKLFKKYQLRNIVFFFFFFIQIGIGQNYLSKQFTTYQGLPDNNICSIFKDKDNQLWVGTNNGLALFRGKSIQIFKKKDGLAHNSCWAILQDKKGQIWIGTLGGGLSLYKNGKFQNFTIKNGLPSNKIRRLYLKGNEIYIGTSNGFSKINIYTHKIKNYYIKDKRTNSSQGVRDFEVLSILEVKNKIIFSTHSHGIYVLENDRVVPLYKKLFTTFSLFRNKNDVFISKNGLAEKGKSIIKINDEAFVNGSLDFSVVKSPNTIFWNFITTKEGLIFAGADGVENNTGGLFEYTGEFKNANTGFGINSSKIWSLYYDKVSNLLYVGTIGEGLYVVDLHKKYNKLNDLFSIGFFKNEYYKNVLLTRNNLRIETKNLKLTFTYDDIYKLLKSELTKLPNQFQTINNGINAQYDRKGFSIKSIELQKNKIYINTSYGLLEFYFLNQKLQTNFWNFSFDTFEFENNGLFFYYPYHSVYYLPNYKNKNDFIRYDQYIDKKFPKNIIDIISTENDKYFISRTEGLFVLKGKNPKEFNFPLHYQGMEFVAAHLYSKHQIVLGTIEGDVFLLDDKNNLKLTPLFDKNDIIGNTIYKILSYKKYILIFTEKGINCLHSSRKESYLIDSEMGIKYKNIASASFTNDLLLLATDEGAYEIDFKKFLLAEINSKFPYFVDKFYVNNNLVLTSNTFKYDENVIRIELGCAFQLYPNKLLFQYHLKGLKNTSWSTWLENTTIDLPHVPPGNYELILKYKNLSTGLIGIQSIKKFEIYPPIWQNGYFIVTLILLIAILIFLYVKYKVETIKKRQLEKNAYEKRIIETKMEALQSQMNPHFVFNSLNVIQNFVIKNDVENSITYINNFSKLMRTTLENSSEFKISIADEIQFLKLYVDVQNIRFNNQVKFKTVISKTLDKYQKNIPPMLIQPLLENCFEHAFNDSIQNPEIILEIKNDMHKIIVTVTDNGQGFKKDKETKMQSKALKLVEERIQLLHKDNSLIFKSTGTGTVVVLDF